MKELLKKPLPLIPADIAEQLEHPDITLTPFENRNDVLCDGALQQEVGYGQFPDGSWLVAMTCPMPGITAKMIRWWFWWHPQAERIGGVRLPLRIDFVSPKDFGFSEQALEDNQIPMIVCGHVSAIRGLVPHTEMVHIFRQTGEGLLLISRFWIGKTLKNPLLRKVILTEETARGMAEHCCVEYRNLAEILPELYKKYAVK